MESKDPNTPLRPPQCSTSRADWPIPTALIALSIVPLIGGIVRLTSLTSQTVATPDNARFLAAPIPVAIHILASLAFCIIGAFQFAPSFRQRHPEWHRMAGRWLMVAGVIAALSGVWMTVFYTIPQPLQGSILYVARLFFGIAMMVSIVLAWSTIRRKNIAGHRTWIMRAYAIGQAAGTQVIIILPYTALLGQPEQFARDILMTAAWIVNLAIVEWIARRKPVRQRKQAVAPAAII